MLTPKEYLRQVKRLDVYINQRLGELKELKSNMCSVPAVDYSADKVTHSRNNDVCKAVDRYIDLSDEINEQIDELAALRHKIIDEIQALNNVVYVQLLYKRYIEYKSLWDIAEDMNYSYRHIRRLHGLALLKFGKELKQDERDFIQREKQR